MCWSPSRRASIIGMLIEMELLGSAEFGPDFLLFDGKEKMFNSLRSCRVANNMFEKKVYSWLMCIRLKSMTL